MSEHKKTSGKMVADALFQMLMTIILWFVSDWELWRMFVILLFWVSIIGVVIGISEWVSEDS